MTPMARTLAAGATLAAALILVSTPILAQRQGQGDGNRPSRQCAREIAKLCGRDRSQIQACLREKASELSSECQSEMRARMQQRRQQASPHTGAFQRAVRPTRTVSFGEHQRQQVDVYEPEGAVEPLPLVLFVHGGGWRMGSHERVQTKPAHFGAQEVYFASTGYRLLPDYPVEDQASDVGAAVQALVGQAGALGFDAERIVLMGHSAGAHLAALVATDPQYAGEAFGAIKGVILLDGAGYDIAQNIEDAEFQTRRIYEDAFGFDEARRKALSPIAHVGGPDAPNWLALYVAERASAKWQAEWLVNALTQADRSARAVAITGTDHGRMNREIGVVAGKAQTEAIDAFLAEVFE
ncbi:MAG: alpha/beta hydrolase [Erythrobacter sp.]|uniref:alpha/beta hydrolase n=1 Tax=Erythrobacter sp. TaxID=1042 RepID=UPI0026035E2E|nr:alpha/beta hydrolase [Erythrobacter sp.]MDJ0976917.1 alpha/beta hydrolase [Erythrobacter sp.]